MLEERICEMANRYLNKDGQSEIKDLIEAGEIEIAVGYILGAVDTACEKRYITEHEAREEYEALGYSPEEAAQIRQEQVMKPEHIKYP